MTIHPYFDEPKSPDEMKQIIGCDNYKLYDAWVAQEDYKAFCLEIGMTEEEIQVLVQNESDMTDFDEETDVYKSESIISGEGLFAKDEFSRGEPIGKATIGDKRTPLGRYTNHSHSPNVEPRVIDGNCMFFANQFIEKDTELTVNYRDTTKLRSQP